jgi:hypothetical protein
VLKPFSTIAALCASVWVCSACAEPAGDYAAHIAKLPKLDGFTICVEPPFVVIGDETAEMVNRRATGSVRWAVARLKKDYFARDPEEIIDIWLFRDRESYTNHAWTLFKSKPTTPFGYYSPEHHALVMNIATGGGTLVHEMVHAFLGANFPECPSWFNEGLASLYEASSERNGHIVGLINWRYKALENAIRERRVISFKELTAKRGADFYGGKTYNEHYAQARYLCFYLQEKGLLHKFYREFVKNVQLDPTGYETLRRVLGNPDMKTFQTTWEKFTLDQRPR